MVEDEDIYTPKRMRVCLVERHMVQEYGAIDPPLACTGVYQNGCPFQCTHRDPKAAAVLPRTECFNPSQNLT